MSIRVYSLHKIWNTIVLFIYLQKNLSMPTLFILFGFRFFFWSNDHEPIHVHISKGDSEAKFNVLDLELVENFGFKRNELRMIESIIEENREIIIARWNEWFGNR